LGSKLSGATVFSVICRIFFSQEKGRLIPLWPVSLKVSVLLGQPEVIAKAIVDKFPALRAALHGLASKLARCEAEFIEFRVRH